MKRFLRITALFAVIFALLAGNLSASAATDTEPDIEADHAVIFNAETGGEILYGKNETDPIYCGFLSRVMTTLLIVESCPNLDETVEITREMLTNTPLISSVKLSEGDRISYRDLIVCIHTANAQEAAVAAAFSIAGSLSEFVGRMNARAKELGAIDTVFTNVTGSYVSNTRQISTLSDCAKIISEALTHEEILSATEQRIATVTINGRSRKIYTKNMLIEKTGKYYNSAARGLFVYSEESSNTSIASCRKDSSRLIVSMAVTDEGLASAYSDAGALLKYSQNRYTTKTLLAKGDAIGEIRVRYGSKSDFVVLLSADEISAYLPKIYGEEDIERVVNAPEELQAPIEKGAVLGTVTVYCAGKEYGTVDLIAQNSVELDNFELYSDKVASVFANRYLWLTVCGIFLLVGGYILLAWMINRPKKRKKTPSSHTGGRIRVRDGEDDEE